MNQPTFTALCHYWPQLTLFLTMFPQDIPISNCQESLPAHENHRSCFLPIICWVALDIPVLSPYRKSSYDGPPMSIINIASILSHLAGSPDAEKPRPSPRPLTTRLWLSCTHRTIAPSSWGRNVSSQQLRVVTMAYSYRIRMSLWLYLMSLYNCTIIVTFSLKMLGFSPQESSQRNIILRIGWSL